MVYGTRTGKPYPLPACTCGAPRIGRRITHEINCLRGIGAAKIALAEYGDEPTTRFYEETSAEVGDARGFMPGAQS